MAKRSTTLKISGFLVLGLVVAEPVVAADVVAKPGDSGTIRVPLRSSPNSSGTTIISGLNAVGIPSELQPHITIGPMTVLGTADGFPFAIEKGETKVVEVPIQIKQSLPGEPTFSINFRPTMDSFGEDPEVEALATSVNNNIADPHFLVGAGKLMFPDFATQNARKPGFRDLCYSETHARSITARGYLAGVRA